MNVYVLIVDADSMAAEVTGAFVRRIAPDATVLIERSPEEAWRAWQHCLPDVLMIDPAPHGPTSLQLIQVFKQARPDARVIVLASTPTPGLRQIVQAQNVDAYVEKPARLSLVMEQLRPIFQQREPEYAVYAEAHAIA